MIRRILLVVLVVIVGLISWYGPMVRYGLEQGVGQLTVIWNARPAEEMLSDPSFPDSLKEKLKWIETVRALAIDSLGLKDTENYRTVYDQRGKEVLWVVTACEPFQLKPKLWEFPIVGSVPYKGYFDKTKAVAEGKALEREGWDVSVRNPGGWSTLGWFTDPILSGMLERNEGDLASLIIHEMVHATLWVKDSIDFNENLATFIGDTAAYDFLTYRFGGHSRQYDTYLYEDQDYRRYSQHMLRGAKGLDSLYHTFQSTDSLAEKRKKKEAFIRKIVSSLDTLALHNAKEPSQRFAHRLPNNAYFMSFRHYQSRLSRFKVEMNNKFPGNLKGYLRYLAEKYPI